MITNCSAIWKYFSLLKTVAGAGPLLSDAGVCSEGVEAFWGTSGTGVAGDCEELFAEESLLSRLHVYNESEMFQSQ
jgi:hypothetical protein